MELINPFKRRPLLSESLYILLNVLFAVGVLVLVLAIQSPLPAALLVLLSKWRILAVRPRYWFANLQSNLVDIIVSMSVVVFLWSTSGALAAQIIITLMYIGWLLFVKPRSKRVFMAIQAGVAVFMGVNAVMIVSYDWIATVVVALIWFIGYAAARHVLSSHNEVHLTFYSLIWGLVLAEIGWVTYHWTFAYDIPGMGDFKLAQSAIIVLGVSYLAERVYSSFTRHDNVRSSDILLPTLLTVSVILVLIAVFNTVQ